MPSVVLRLGSCFARWIVICASVFAGEAAVSGAGLPEDDPYAWLEDVNGEKALAWVREQNERTAARFRAVPLFDALFRDSLKVLDAQSRLPEVEIEGRYVYNLWKDGDHPRGIYRRSGFESFKSGDPQWETVLDIDQLARKEGRPWALNRVVWLPPQSVRCLVFLSPGGTDAAEVREFDTEKREFVTGGFVIPEAKSVVEWIDADTLYVGTDFGAGTLTESGYPRLVKVWRRGTPLSAAATLYEAQTRSVRAGIKRHRTSGAPIDLLSERLTFWTSRIFQIVDGKPMALELPETARANGVYGGQLVVSLKEDWRRGHRRFAGGSVLLADLDALKGGPGSVRVLVEPRASEAIQEVTPMPQGVLVSMLDNVRGRLCRYSLEGDKVRRESIRFPDNGALVVAAKDDDLGTALVKFESFLSPPSLYAVSPGSNQVVLVAAQEASFDAGAYRVRQHWARSTDGTRIPYFVVGRKSMNLDGRNPVWMFSYGGFETSLTPSYSGSYEELHGAYGKLWLERGGVFVLANIRGGLEFGPTWHTQVLKENHVKTIEDFEAVARDLVRRRITSPRHLGIEGRSNGGLLVAATMVRHPELYGAVVCGVPLTDLRRYHKFLAGASWTGEYGNPEVPEEWAYLSRYSPYQNVQPDRDYPPILFYGSTRDDRVHPCHARKMFARLRQFGYEAEYAENIEGGHHASVTNEQLATRLALTYTFLWQHLR
ncbi:MAG: S9 family peptidase [Verrucomicrobiales bacterium]|nr:S9 family peptidase [Verrucomicrobiales bacterium]